MELCLFCMELLKYWVQTRFLTYIMWYRSAESDTHLFYFNLKLSWLSPIKSTEGTKENICSLQCSEHAECLTHRPWMQVHTWVDEEWTPISRTPYLFINYVQFVIVSVLRCQLACLVLFSVFMPLANCVYMSVIQIGHGIHNWQPSWLNL